VEAEIECKLNHTESDARALPEIPAHTTLASIPWTPPGEEKNWYTLLSKSAPAMGEHGLSAAATPESQTDHHRFIASTIGMGVDLFADDPLVFKKLFTRCASTTSAPSTRSLAVLLGVRVPQRNWKDC